MKGDAAFEVYPRAYQTPIERTYMARKVGGWGSYEHVWHGYALHPDVKTWLRENVGHKNWRYVAATGAVKFTDATKASLFRLQFG